MGTKMENTLPHRGLEVRERTRRLPPCSSTSSRETQRPRCDSFANGERMHSSACRHLDQIQGSKMSICGPCVTYTTLARELNEVDSAVS
jgi:hypothetical protein